jgi:hypothetical protein
MDPAHVDDATFTLSKFLEHSGPSATLAFVGGLLILVLAHHVARRRGPRRHAWALLAACGLTFLPVLTSGTLSELTVFARTTSKWGDPAEFVLLGAGPQSNPAADGSCAIGLFLGLAGCVAAFARSRRERLHA